MIKDSYHHDDLKSELIEKGLTLLDEVGYENFSLRKLAKACNVSHAAPYRHFKNKDELIRAIAIAVMSKFSQTLQAAVGQFPNDPESQLKEMGCAYIRFFTEKPEYLRLIFLSDLNKRLPDLDNDHCFMDNSEHPFGILFKAVERYQAVMPRNTNNEMMDQDALVLYCWGLVHGISILIARNDFPYQGDHLELVRRILWNKAFPD